MGRETVAVKERRRLQWSGNDFAATSGPVDKWTQGVRPLCWTDNTTNRLRSQESGCPTPKAGKLSLLSRHHPELRKVSPKTVRLYEV